MLDITSEVWMFQKQKLNFMILMLNYLEITLKYNKYSFFYNMYRQSNNILTILLNKSK